MLQCGQGFEENSLMAWEAPMARIRSRTIARWVTFTRYLVSHA
jgi:hypothetical protein